MKTIVCTVSLLLGLALLSGCAGGASSGKRAGSSVQVYGTVDTGIGYESTRISRD